MYTHLLHFQSITETSSLSSTLFRRPKHRYNCLPPLLLRFSSDASFPASLQRPQQVPPSSISLVRIRKRKTAHNTNSGPHFCRPPAHLIPDSVCLVSSSPENVAWRGRTRAALSRGWRPKWRTRVSVVLFSLAMKEIHEREGFRTRFRLQLWRNIHLAPLNLFSFGKNLSWTPNPSEIGLETCSNQSLFHISF